MTENFDPLSDADLREALKRKEPPAGFAERALARINQPTADRLAHRPSTQWAGWAGLAAAASIVIAIAIGATQYRAHQRETQARKAAEELTLAMRITSDTLSQVQNKLVNRK